MVYKQQPTKLWKEYVIRCPVHGNITFNALERQIIGHPFFQRLRRIQQLGLVDYVYPGATHNRFSHSLGVMHLVSLFFDHLFAQDPVLSTAKKTEFRQLLRITALLHDLGHLPLSHAVEEHFPTIQQLTPSFEGLKSKQERKARHEDFSVFMIQVLAEQQVIDQELAHNACALIAQETPDKGNFVYQGWNYYPALRVLINSEIDADRTDYLLRDAFYCGVAYGKFDWQQMIRSLKTFYHQNSVKICLSARGLLAYQDFLLSRENMFLQVYYHKTLVSFVEILKLALAKKEIVLNIFNSLDDFVALDDHGLWELLKKHREKKYTNAFFQRVPLRNLFREVNPNEEKQAELAKIKQNLQKEQQEYILLTRHIENNVNNTDLYYAISDEKTAAKVSLAKAYTKMLHPLQNIKLVQLTVADFH